MRNGKPVLLKRAALAAMVLGLAASARAQSPYGLAARQAIPWVVEEGNDRGTGWSTEVNIHNPSPLPIGIMVTYKGAVGTPTPGALACNTVTVAGRGTAEIRLSAVCPLNPGLNYGRLELSALFPGGRESPSDSIFLANARVSQAGVSFFTVEGFPEGNLSGNRGSAVVTGIKGGLVGGTQWTTFCAGAGLNDATAVVVRLFDGNGKQIGNGAAAPLDPPSGIEMQTFPDVFAAVGAPPGNYDNVTAKFASLSPIGAGVFGFCLVVNQNGERAFEVAKYLDNNDEAREYATTVNKTAYGADFAVASEVSEGLRAHSNLHVAYFQHPDRIHCQLNWTSPHSTFDQIHVQLIDPDGQVVATAMNDFRVDLGEKPSRHAGRNGRWLIEVGPDRAYLGDCDAGDLRYNCTPSQVEMTPYTLTCTSGNGHNQLDMIGHCVMTCVKDGSKEAVCAFSNPALDWCWN